MERATLDVCIQVEMWNRGARQDQKETTGMGKPRPGGRTIRKRGARLLGAKAAAASGEEEAVRQ